MSPSLGKLINGLATFTTLLLKKMLSGGEDQQFGS